MESFWRFLLLRNHLSLRPSVSGGNLTGLLQLPHDVSAHQCMEEDWNMVRLRPQLRRVQRISLKESMEEKVGSIASLWFH